MVTLNSTRKWLTWTMWRSQRVVRTTASFSGWKPDKSHQGSATLSRRSVRLPRCFKLRFGSKPCSFAFWYAVSASIPICNAFGRIFQVNRSGSTLTSLPAAKAPVRPLAKPSASRFASLGVHSTIGLIPVYLQCVASSINSAFTGYRVDMSLLSAEPLPRFSVNVAATVSS